MNRDNAVNALQGVGQAYRVEDELEQDEQWTQPMTVALLNAGTSEAAEAVQVDLAADGHTVFSTGSPVDTHGNVLAGDELSAWAACAMATINTCDAVYVVNSYGGVPQEVTAQVIYAAMQGKAIRYLKPLPLG